MSEETIITARRIRGALAVTEFASPRWEEAAPVRLTRYWSGAEAPPERHAEARLVWHDEALCVRFTCRQAEPLVVSAEPRLDVKTIGLWERDVCEIFVAPDAEVPTRYLEFEVAPTGEWLDLRIEQKPEGRETAWDYEAGLSAGAQVAESSVTLTLALPWSAFGERPAPGARWRANLFRCVGAGPTRGYLAWRPTFTPEPNFHVPQAFGWLHFAE